LNSRIAGVVAVVIVIKGYDHAGLEGEGGVVGDIAIPGDDVGVSG